MLRFLLTFAFACCAAASASRAASLLLGSPMPQARAAAPAVVNAPYPAVARSGRVALADVPDMAAALASADTLQVRLFADVAVTAVRHAARALAGGGLYWQGSLTAGRSGVLSLFWRNGSLAGTVSDYGSGKVYDLTAVAQGSVGVAEICAADSAVPDEDCFAAGDEAHDEAHEAAALAARPLAAVTADNPATVDILVLYPTAVAKKMGSTPEDIKVKVESIIEQTNQIFRNSEIYVTFRLVGHAVNDDIPADAKATDDVRYGLGVADMRSACGADIVSFWNNNGSAGIAILCSVNN